MELWIRSQDKEDLVKAYNFRILNESYIAINVENRGAILDYLVVGKYATKERALEVLDEIQNILKPQIIISKIGKPIAETCDGTVYREPDECDIKEISTYVYEMPKE